MEIQHFFWGGIVLSAIFAICRHEDAGFCLGLATLAITAFLGLK